MKRGALAVTLPIAFLLLLALWLLLVGSLDSRELAAGLVAAALGTLAAGLVLRGELGEGRRHFPVRGLWELPLRAVRDSLLVLAVTVLQALRLRRVQGRFVTRPSRVAADTPLQGRRRALEIARRSFAPNTVVLGYDRERQEIVLHQLVARERDA